MAISFETDHDQSRERIRTLSDRLLFARQPAAQDAIRRQLLVEIRKARRFRLDPARRNLIEPESPVWCPAESR